MRRWTSEPRIGGASVTVTVFEGYATVRWTPPSVLDADDDAVPVDELYHPPSGTERTAVTVDY